jgi:hypothetical protein
MQILVSTLNSKTEVGLINGQPDLSSFSEPTKSILQAAFDNGDYVELPESEPTPQVREIHARRLRLALLQLGHLATVAAAISTLGEAAVIDWEYATIIREDYPLVQALSTHLGLNVDEIFTLAETLP